MLYIEPYGGLCNRMRAVASAFTMSHSCGSGLTIVWKKENGLNCRFDDLFIKAPEINVAELRKHSPMSYLFRLGCNRRYFDLNEKKDLAEIEKMKLDVASGKIVYLRTCHQFFDVNGYSIFKFSDYIQQKVSNIMKLNGGVYGRYTYQEN